MSRQEAMRRLSSANPISTGAVSSLVPAAQRADLLERIVRMPPAPPTHAADVTRGEDTSPNGTPSDAPSALRSEAGRRRRPTRRTLVLLSFVAAAILAGAAYAVVHKLVVGDPAPQEFREQPALFGHSAELIPVPHPDDPQLEKAHVAAVLDSSVGTIYLFASPNARGICGSIWREGDRGYQGRLNISSFCGPTEESTYMASFDKPNLFAGHAGDKVARVAVRVADRIIAVPLTGRWFFAELPGPADEFLSYDANGQQVEKRAFHWHFPRGRQGFAPIPHQVTHALEVAQIEARGGERISLFVAKANDGGYCQIVRSDRRPSNRGCSVAVPKPHELGVSGMNFGGAPGGVLLLVGPTGSQITTLELLYQDGRVDPIPLHDGWALYEVVPARYAQGHRPEKLIARDANGQTVATKGFPWG
jgi:hypothetical protein